MCLNVGFSFLPHSIDFIAVHDSIVVSAIDVFRPVDSLRPHLWLASLRLFTNLITRSARLQSQAVTPGYHLLPCTKLSVTSAQC